MIRFAMWAVVVSIPILGSSPVYASAISPLICSNPGSTVAGPNASGVHANSCTDFAYSFPVPQPASGVNNWQYGYYTGTTLDPNTFSLMSPTPAVDGSGNVIPGQNAGWWSKNFFQYWTALDAFGSHSNADYTDYHTPPYCTPGVSCNPTNPALGGYDPRSPIGPDSGDYWAARRYIIPTGYTGPVAINLQVQKDPRTATGNAQGIVEYVIDHSGNTTSILGQVSVPVNQNPNLPNLPPTVAGGIGQPIYTLFLPAASVKPGDTLDFVTAPNLATFSIGAGVATGYVDFSSGSFQLIQLDGIPEPSTWMMMAGGLLALGLLRKRLTV